MEVLKASLEYLGYKVSDNDFVFSKGYEPIRQLISGIQMLNLEVLKPLPLYEVKLLAIKFLNKYFALHNVKTPDIHFYESIQKKVPSDEEEALSTYRKYASLLKDVNPLDLNIELVDGHSMVGEVEKSLFVIEKKFVPSDIGIIVPFSKIKLGKQLSILSASTYIHEIAHTQQESHPGYAESYLNKEVISIFLEKVSVLESDLTGEILKASERMRFLDLLRIINILSLDGKVIKLDPKEKLEHLMYLRSTLLAQKLFDLYISERKQKNKDKYLCDVQDVFDGKITIEELLKRRNVTINQAKDISLIKRHM